MIPDLLFELACKSVLSAGATLLLLRLLRSRSAAEKAVVANAGLLALILLPLFILWLPRIELPAPAATSEMLPAFVAATAEAAPTTSPIEPIPATDWSQVIAALYFIPFLLLLIGLAAALSRLQRVRSRAEVMLEPLWLGALARAQQRFGLKHGTALLTSGELNSPVSWGVVRPVIIIDSAAAADVEQAEAIITHELAHVVRLDWLKLLMGRAATALFWFNPLVWLLARRSHQLGEEAADDAVLRSSIGQADYAELLLGAARHANRPFLLAANGVAPSRSSIAQRIEHVLDGSRSRRRAQLGWAALALLGALALNGALAAAEPTLETSLGTRSDAGEAAAARLLKLKTPQARALGSAIARADWSLRKATGVTTFWEPAAAAPLMAALADDRPAVRRIALWGLSEMRPAPNEAAAAPVARLLADPSPEIRGEAARALGEFGAAAYVPQVAALLRDHNPAVRRQAAHALGDLQSPAARPALEAARADPDPAVRAKVQWALRQVAEAETILRRY